MKKNKQIELLTLSNLIMIVILFATYLQLVTVNTRIEELASKF